MNIQINEPCHEDWQAMTPNQQGAFCKVCHKDVVDFSQKSISQIKSFFADKTEEKICGRFEKKQLVYLSFDDFFASFKYWALSKKFAVIFFCTFGFMAFDASAQSGTKVGKVAAPIETHTMGEPAVAKPEQHLQGDVAYTPNDTIKKITPPIMGKVKCTNIPKDKKPKSEPKIMGAIAPPKKVEKKTK
ncbi:MAG: hypothetical protein ABI388_09825 [Bacteroidia bacterium]